MKRILLFLILLVAFTWPSAGGNNSPSLTFDDLGLGGGGPTEGTYNSNDTFSFDVLLTFEGYNSTGLSYWLETNTAFAGSLSITGITYGTTFPDPGNPTFPILFDSGTGDYRGETFDLGASINDFNNTVPPGTYLVAHITFSIAGAAPGTYDLRSTTANPYTSGISTFDGTTFADHDIPATHYSVTIVPEPTALALVGLGAIGVMVILRRQKKR